MSSYVFEEAQEAYAAVKKIAGAPQVGLILGSGLGGFAKLLKNARVVPYARIPNFPPARVEGHAGQLIFCTFRGVEIAVLAGRVHYYEGHALEEVTLPTRVLGLLGVKVLLVTNAAGGIAPALDPGDLMVITDHINLLGTNPLRGPKDPRLGPRFPDMTNAYHPLVRAALYEAADAARVPVKCGVYAALGGPSYETPAEIKMLATLGADAVGMSTVPEVIVANQMGMKVGGISCVANKAAGISPNKLSHEEVMETTQSAAKRFCKLLAEAIPLAAKAANGPEQRSDKHAKIVLSLREKCSVGNMLKGSKK